MEAFFESHGFTAEMFPPTVEILGDYLASGTTDRGTSHMVVMRGGKLLHDPHPSNAGLELVQAVWIIARKAVRTTPPANQEKAKWTDADSDAARLALELECLLLDTKDTAAVSRWWSSALEALELHRARINASHSQAQQPNEWRDMIQERFDVNHSAMPSDPREAVLKLIRDEVSMALDPACSSQAEALIHRGRDEAQQPMPRLCIGYSHMESLIDAAIQSHSEAKDAMRWLVRQLAKPPSGGEVPLGAIINGREHARRLVESYGFADLADHKLELCTDWIELLRCFEHLADYVQHTTPPAPKQPMTPKQVKALMSEIGYDNATAQERSDFINGIRNGEAHHGITSAKDGGV